MTDDQPRLARGEVYAIEGDVRLRLPGSEGTVEIEEDPAAAEALAKKLQTAAAEARQPEAETDE